MRHDKRSLDRYVETVDLAEMRHHSQDFVMEDHQIRYYQQHAARGNAWANNHLGQMYLFGLRGVPQNVEMAAQHFEAAVAADDPFAAQHLAKMYWNGMGKKRNLNKTRELLLFAAEQNVTSAMNDLAFMHWKGIGMKRNMTAALMWFKRAAEGRFVAVFSLKVSTFSVKICQNFHLES